MAVRGSIPKTMKALVAYSKDDYRLELGVSHSRVRAR